MMRGLPSKSVVPCAYALFPLSMLGEVVSKWKLLDAVLTNCGSFVMLPVPLIGIGHVQQELNHVLLE
jgi:hypothetical protein